MSSHKVRFSGSGDETLVGRLDEPADSAAWAYALFAHCFTCSKDLAAAVNLSRALTAARIAVLRFDFTGLGESEGEFADTNFSSNVEDLVAAARFLEREREAPALLVGHSLGGAAVLKAASAIPSARAVATLAAPADPAHATRLLASSREELEARGEAEVEIAGRRFRIRRQLLEDLGEQPMREAIGGLDRALLIFHSPVDAVVGIENAERIFKAAKHPKSFVSLDRADHLLSDRADSAHAGRVLAAWARRYIGAPADERPDAPADREGGVVARIGASGLRTELVAGGHALVADEPVSVGGTGEGPTPYDLVAAGLGACTAMTLRLYADRKQWPLEGAGVRLKHRKVHAADCEECEEGEARLDEIERRLTLEGPLDAAQRARLLEIANRCPVHRTLEGGARIVTSLEDGAGAPEDGEPALEDGEPAEAPEPEEAR